MDRSAVLTLVSEVQTQDSYGIFRTTTSTRDVFCQVNSVSRQEFFEAGRNGLNPEYEFTMFAGDYQGERMCIYDGQQYNIYRTYIGRNDAIELYAERTGGTNLTPEEVDPDGEVDEPGTPDS